MAPLEDTLQHIISIYDNGCQAGFERTLYAYPFCEPCLFVSLFQLTERQWKTNGILYFLFFMQGFMWISKQGNWMLQLLFSWAMIPWTLTTCTSIYHFTAHLPVRKKKKRKKISIQKPVWKDPSRSVSGAEERELWCRDPQAASLHQKEDCAQDHFSKYLEEEGKDYDDM